jgi:hypothetical protein
MGGQAVGTGAATRSWTPPQLVQGAVSASPRRMPRIRRSRCPPGGVNGGCLSVVLSRRCQSAESGAGTWAGRKGGHVAATASGHRRRSGKPVAAADLAATVTSRIPSDARVTWTGWASHGLRFRSALVGQLAGRETGAGWPPCRTVLTMLARPAVNTGSTGSAARLRHCQRLQSGLPPFIDPRNLRVSIGMTASVRVRWADSTPTHSRTRFQALPYARTCAQNRVRDESRDCHRRCSQGRRREDNARLRAGRNLRRRAHRLRLGSRRRDGPVGGPT